MNRRVERSERGVVNRVLIVGAVVLAASVVACGSDGDSTFGDGNGGSGPGYDDGSQGSGVGEIGPGGTNSACVSEVADAALTPTNLVFMYDKSGSMGYLQDSSSFDPNKKWVPVGQGLKTFFADPYSKTLRASIQFFPDGDLPDPPGAPDPQRDVNEVCSFDYTTPKVALTQASDAAFVQAIDAQTPEGGTPTVPALKGAITYAEQIAAQRPGEKTAVVFVTDGEPGFNINGVFQGGCQNMPNTVAEAANLAKAAAAKSIPVYVIGVGSSLDKLNAIASAGGTSAAMMVDISDPAQTSSKIVTTLNSIRTREVACDFALPPPPKGEELDPFAVNVVLKKADGSEQVLSYDKECSSGDGWRYDDINAPKRVQLCTASCSVAQEATSGNVTIAFGCKTKIAVR